MAEQIKRRNPVALSPLLRKGGVHEKSKTAIRRNNNLALTRTLDDWEEELAFEREIKEGVDGM